MAGKKKKVVAAKSKTMTSKKISSRGTKEERRAQKLERRKREKRLITADMWAAPAPSHLVAKLDAPLVKSKYQSYFEFAENPDKMEKKLETKVMKQSDPPPAGCAFVAIGNPELTNKCKEISRERDAMIFPVSSAGEEKNNKVSDHVHRVGYHFRQSIIKEATEWLEARGEAPISNPVHAPGEVEPIPESQEEINKQANAAIRDLFPRIPHTDRSQIVEHAFRKGTMFHGEPTVGLQANIPLARRVQLAVLAHIRHTHTRYDKLLRETSWINARKAVEPVCLDVLVKWRGDEETGRDQLDEILREVVIITDSEDEDDSSEEDESSEEEGEVTSINSSEAPSRPDSHAQHRQAEAGSLVHAQNDTSSGSRNENAPANAISSRTRSKVTGKSKDKKAQRGFQRYRAAWDNARIRQQEPLSSSHASRLLGNELQITSSGITPTMYSPQRRPVPSNYAPLDTRNDLSYRYEDHASYATEPMHPTKPASFYTHPSEPSTPFLQRNEVIVRPSDERPVLYQDLPHRAGTSYPVWNQGPPQVVRGSPTGHGLQDMLVPSIENGPSDFSSPRLAERNGSNSNFFSPQAPYRGRAMERRMHSPAEGEVIVINDDTPPMKRRRLIREDEVRRLKPLPPRDQNVQIPVTHSDSRLITTSSAQQGDYFVQQQRASPPSAQGLYRDSQPIYTDPTTSERLPIYDEPEVRYFGSHPVYQRPDDIRFVNRQQYPSENFPENKSHHPGPNHLQSWNDNMEIIERDHRAVLEPAYGNGSSDIRRWSPHFPVPAHNISRSSDMGPGSVVQNQDLIHSFSQSRLDGHSSHTRNGFSQLPEGFHQNIAQRSAPYYERFPATSYAPVPVARARSPVQYAEHPIRYRNEPQQDAYHEQRPLPVEYLIPYERPAPAVQQQQLPPPRGPIWSRPLDPRRQIIAVD